MTTLEPRIEQRRKKFINFIMVFGLKLKAQPAVRHFEPVREQFAADAALFKEAGES